jgi:CzcA family heavy metal efflux pump
MLNRIIDFALKNRFLVVIASSFLLIFGTYIAANMEVDVLPDLTAPSVVVLTEAHGMAPDEVEKLVTFQIESAVNGSTNVRRVRSSSSAGISIVWVEFEWGTDIYIARQIVAEKISSVREKLPQGTGDPTLAPQSSIMGEIMLISVSSDITSPIDLRTITDWTIRPKLLATGGVSQVVVIGGEFKQYQILASPQKMNYFNVSISELLKAAEESNENASGGFMNEYGNEYIITGFGRTGDVFEIGKSVIKTVDNYPIKIEDVSEIKIGSATKIGDASVNGNPAIIMTVMKQPSTNTIELTEEIDNTILDLKKSLPEDVKINTNIFRQADFIEASISNINKTLIEGSLFVIIILFIFLMNWRATVISIIAIPISLIIAILTLKWLGLTINTMSLGGMAIAIGALVDDAIIDVENVFKRLKENSRKPPDERRGKLKVIFNASVEIRTSIINATLIIIVAFVPLFFLSGMEGRLLAPLGISFIVSLFASLIVSITLTPVLCSYLLTSEDMLEKHSDESKLVKYLQRKYVYILEKVMNAKKLILAAAIGLFAVSMILLLTLGRNFLPEFNEGSLVISAVSLPGISLEESGKIGTEIEKTLLTIPEIPITARRTGRSEMDEHALGVNTSEVEAPFKLGERSRSEFMDDVREKLTGVTGANITIGQPIGHRIDHMLSGTRSNIAIKIYGQDLNQMFSISNKVKSAIENIQGLVDISVEPQIEIPQIKIKAKREVLAKYGITIGEFTRMIDVGFAGEKVSEVFEGSKRFDIVLRYNSENRGNIENIKNAMIDTQTGEKIPLSYVADIVSSSGPNTVNRENLQRKTVVSVNVSGRDQRSAVDEIRSIVNSSIELPEGYSIEYGGQFEAEEEASRRLMIASLLSFLIIFILLYQEFKDMKLSAIILLNLPLALIGGVLSIYFTSGIISIPSIIGFITLFRNSYPKRNSAGLKIFSIKSSQGIGIYQTIIEGSKDRLSPILMTALTAGLALVPLAIAGDLPGNEIQSPMAIVILGGLFSSTLLNLLVIPIVYFLINNKTEKFNKT